MTTTHIAAYAPTNDPRNGSTKQGKAVQSSSSDAADRATVSPRAKALHDAEALQRLDLIRKRVLEGFYSSPDVIDAVVSTISREV